MDDEKKKTILKLARNTIESYVKDGVSHKFNTEDEELKQQNGAFVTLHKNGALRGCIGLIESDSPLYETIMDMSIQAARSDPRFPPVEKEELNEIDIEVSILTKPRKAGSIDEVEPGKHGVIVKKGFASGVFLPQVAAETGWSKEEFMENLCEGKAGLHKDAYKDPAASIYVFEAEVFGEKDFDTA